MKRLSDRREYRTPQQSRVEAVVLGQVGQIASLDARVGVLESAAAGVVNSTTVDMTFTLLDSVPFVVVTGLDWVTSATVFSVTVLASGATETIDLLLSQIQAMIGDVSNGVGFTVYGLAATAIAATVKVHVVGVG